jgi:preprotein translocase subunit SecG
MSILLGILTFILILVSIFLVLVVLMQKSKDGGIGAALGGGATEAAFGADTTNVLTQATKYSAILFFVLAFALYLGRLHERAHGTTGGGRALPNISVPAAPATPAPAAGGAATAPVTGIPPVSLPSTTPPATTPIPDPTTTTPAAPNSTPASPAPEPKK